MKANKAKQEETKKQIQGGIHIEILKTGFFAGDLIQGQLKFFLGECCTGRFLQISLEGYEQSSYTIFKNGDKSKMLMAQGFEKFLDFQIPAHDFSQGTSGQHAFILKPGQWQIPFQLKISETLPQSFHTGYIQGISVGSVTYQLVATFLPQDPSILPIQAKQEIYIQNSFKINSNPPPLRTYQFGVKEGCCVKNETKLIVNLSTDKLVYQPGEHIILNYTAELGNQSVKEFKVEVNSSIVLKSHLSDKKEKKTIFEVEQKIPVKSQSVKETVKILIPHNAQYTYDGKFNQNQKSYQVTPKSNDSCVSISDYSFPILFGPPQFLLSNKFPEKIIDGTPQNWKPAIFQGMVFNKEQLNRISVDQTSFNQKYLENSSENNEQSQFIGVNTSLQPLNMPQMFAITKQQGQQQNFR